MSNCSNHFRPTVYVNSQLDEISLFLLAFIYAVEEIGILYDGRSRATTRRSVTNTTGATIPARLTQIIKFNIIYLLIINNKEDFKRFVDSFLK